MNDINTDDEYPPDPCTMDELIAARELQRKVNAMDIEDFACMVARHTGISYEQEKVDHFKFVGLSNIDYFEYGFYKDPDEIIIGGKKT